MQVRIIGTPRSGTNLAKYLVGRHLGVETVFNRGFWKHGVFPALVEDGVLGHGGLPVIVMVRDPIAQIVAWYRVARGPAVLFGKARDLRHFADGPLNLELVSYPPQVIRYRFARPIDYWNQFYFAPLSLLRSGAPVHLVRYDDLVRRPAASLRVIAAFLGLDAGFADDGAVDLPPATFHMTDDDDGMAGDKMLKREVPFDAAGSSLATAVAQLGRRRSLAIVGAADPEVLEAAVSGDYRAEVDRLVRGLPWRDWLR